MARLLPVICTSLLASVSPLWGQHSIRGATEDVVAGFVYVRFASGTNLSLSAEKTGLDSFDQIAARLGARDVRRAFPMLDRPIAQRAQSHAAAMLRNVYAVVIDARHDPVAAARQLMGDPHVVHAEPKRIPTVATDFTSRNRLDALPIVPDDPAYGSAYLKAIKMPEAWDVVRGEGDRKGKVVIAFVDGPANWNHNDLSGNLWTNPGEIPGNGLDDDQNGFVDDMHGWTFYNGSADLLGGGTPQVGDHGTLVSGVAAAETNNSVAIAGTAWNTARFIAVNAACSDADRSSICHSNEAVLYAAAHGAHIINASFAGPGTSAVEDAVY